MCDEFKKKRKKAKKRKARGEAFFVDILLELSDSLISLQS